MFKLICIFLMVVSPVLSQHYDLQPVEIKPGVWIIYGKQEPMSSKNGAAIANIGFIIGKNSVLVIDSGPTHLFAEEVIKSIKRITNLPISNVVITHRHPDHSFGINTFLNEGVKIVMDPLEASAYSNEGKSLLNFMTDIIGEDWTKNTIILDSFEFKGPPSTIDLGERKVNLYLYHHGHSLGDILIHDITSNILFTGDLVFNNRAATIPHASIKTWLEQLELIKKMQWEIIIPGHGPAIYEVRDIDKTFSWLEYMRDKVKDGLEKGDSPAELISAPLPEKYNNMVDSNATWQRSVRILYKRYSDIY